jgi:hypothetical protein
MADRNDEIRGIGGWLLLFVLTLGVMTPLSILYILLATFSNGFANDQLPAAPGWVTYRAAETLMRCAHLLVCLFLTWRLCKVRTWQTIRLTIALIWMTGVGVALGDVLLIVALLGDPFDRVLYIELGIIVRTLVYATLSTAYLLTSRRVANTYPRPSDERRPTAVFS